MCRRATVPGLNLCTLFIPPAICPFTGFDLPPAIYFFGVLFAVDFLAVCFVRAIYLLSNQVFINNLINPLYIPF